MMKRLLAALFFISNLAFATTFKPTSAERLVFESQAVVHAVFQGESYKMLPSGQVVTEGTFSVIRSAGLNPNEILNKNSFKVLYPGGMWHGIVYKVYGSPRFTAGEEVVLLLSKSAFGYSVHSLTAGKYKVVRERGDTPKLISSAFPNHDKFGELEFAKFNSILANRFGSGFDEGHSDKYIHTKQVVINPSNEYEEEAQRRKPASEEEKGPFNSNSTIWLAIIFGVMGAIFLRLVKREKKS